LFFIFRLHGDTCCLTSETLLEVRHIVVQFLKVKMAEIIAFKREKIKIKKEEFGSYKNIFDYEVAQVLGLDDDDEDENEVETETDFARKNRIINETSDEDELSY
jgi:hypothetical protein